MRRNSAIKMGASAPPPPTFASAAYYKVDSNSNDFFGNFNGVDTNTAYVSGGVVGNRLDLTSTTISRVNIDVSGDPFFKFCDATRDLPFSISTWINFKTVKNSWFIHKRNGASFSAWQFIYYQGNLQFDFVDENNRTKSCKTTGFTASANTNYNFQVTHDSNGVIRLYVNSVEMAVIRIADPAYTKMSPSSMSDVFFGWLSWNSALYLDGYLDEIFFSKEPHTQEQVDYIYNQGLNGLPLFE